MKDPSRDAIMLAFMIYAVYMEGLKGLFKCIFLPVGTHFILASGWF